MLSEVSQAKKTTTILFHLYEVSRLVRFIETENRMAVPRDWGREGMCEMGNFCLMNIEFQF